jgi:hypothetical protein
VDRAQTNAKNSYIVPYMHICAQRVRKENDDDDDDDDNRNRQLPTSKYSNVQLSGQ